MFIAVIRADVQQEISEPLFLAAARLTERTVALSLRLVRRESLTDRNYGSAIQLRLV